VSSLILRTVTRFFITVLLLFSVFLLLRGHNEPGGGFIGGLTAAGAFALHSIAFDVQSTRRALRIEPRTLIGSGLLVAIVSGMMAIFADGSFLQGLWGYLDLPAFGRIEVGTPLLFDIGVFLVVLGVILTIVLSLEEE
jgi:multicomponent Na+:H+ antiporter subunit B